MFTPNRGLPMSFRTTLSSTVLALGALAGVPGASVAQLPPMPPGLDSAEVARARGCAVVEAVYAQGQEVGVALQDSLIFMDGLLNRLEGPGTFDSGSTPDGRAYLTFPAGEGELARVDTVFASSDLYPLVTNFRSWRNNNQARVDAGEAEATTQYQRRRTDLLNYVRSRGRGMLEQYQQLPQLLQNIQIRGQMCTADVALLRPAVIRTCDAEEVNTQICQAARADSAFGSVTFVPSVSEIWAIQETNPWEPHRPLESDSLGAVTGGSVASGSRAGNALVQLAVAPLIRAKENLEQARIDELQMVLDSLGIAFTHPEFAFVPTLEIRTNITRPVAGERYYLLHTGDPNTGASIWSAQSNGQLLGAQIVMSPDLLDILTGAEEILFSAVRVVNEDTLETIWSLPVSAEGRAAAVSALMAYYGSAFAADLDAAAAASAAVGAPGGG